MDIGTKMRVIRKSKGFTQIDLAAKAGIAVNSLRLYEANKRQPRADQLQAIAVALDVSVGDLLDVKPAHAVDPNETDAEREKRLGLPEGYFKRLATPEEAARRDKLLDSFMEMNATGQQKAVEQVSDLAKIPDYQKPKTPK